MSVGTSIRPGGGVDFAVWAPERRRVVLDWQGRVGGGRVAMRRGRGGVWRATVPDAGPGARYRYYLDDDGPFPDPYARSLPDGVHGAAEVVDPGAFRWHDADWSGLSADGLIVYELHVGTFTPAGTFEAVIGQLAALRRLGVNALQIMPIASFPGQRNWGYDGVGHYAPDASYGGPGGLRRLIDAAHQRGLGVILDVVYNHLGPSGNYLGQFAPAYFTDRYRTPWGDALNYDGPDGRRVRDWAIDNAIHYLTEYHADGLRLDATHEIHDASRVHLLRELTRRARAAVARPIVLIAEDERNDVRLVSRGPGGVGLDAVWADDFHHALRTLVTGDRSAYFADYAGTAEQLLDAIRHGFVYRGQLSQWSGHPRGRPTGRVPARAFVFCIENHDQVGNRALGERLAHLVSPPTYRAASAVLLTAPETPMLFMGQEFAAETPFQFFTDHEPDLGRLVTEGRRKEFAAFPSFRQHLERVPDPQHPATFERSKLRLDERRRNAEVHRLYRDLLALRASDPRLRCQDRLGLRAAALGEKALAFGWRDRLVVASFGAELETRLPPSLRVGRGRWRLLLNTDARRYGGAGRRATLSAGRLTLPPETAAVFARP
jgi:maltooligosyltrehalose trehalohydrolase